VFDPKQGWKACPLRFGAMRFAYCALRTKKKARLRGPSVCVQKLDYFLASSAALSALSATS